MHPQQYYLRVLDIQVRRKAIAHFTANSIPSNRFEQNRWFTKDIQIQICKPKQNETLMKSKYDTDDG